MTLILNDTQHNVILPCTIFILVLGVAFFVAKLNVILPTVVMLGVVIPSVGAPFFYLKTQEGFEKFHFHKMKPKKMY